MPIPSILEWEALKRLLGADLEQRVAALEAKLSGDGTPRAAPLAERNAERQDIAERLQAQIASILPECPKLTAKAVLRRLEQSGWAPLPSVRTVQRHIDSLRHATDSV